MSVIAEPTDKCEQYFSPELPEKQGDWEKSFTAAQMKQGESIMLCMYMVSWGKAWQPWGFPKDKISISPQPCESGSGCYILVEASNALSVRAWSSTEDPEKVRRNIGTRLFFVVKWKVTLDVYTIKFKCLDNFVSEKWGIFHR